MKPEVVIAMARAAGLQLNINVEAYPVIASQIQRFADLVAEKEREACARACESMHEEDRPGDYAYAIRARSKP